MRTVPDQVASTTFVTANAGASTVAAVADEIHVLLWIAWSYDANSTAIENITVSFGGTTVLALPIAIADGGKVHFLDFRSGEHGGLHNNTKNEAMVITLDAPAGGAAGKLNYAYR